MYMHVQIPNCHGMVWWRGGIKGIWGSSPSQSRAEISDAVAKES
jgi:hypothetical protein